MWFSPPISSPTRRHQELINESPLSSVIIRKVTLALTSHSNTRCKGMFDLFMIEPIRTNDAQRDCSAFLVLLSPAICGICPKIKHRWSKSEAMRRNIEVGISLRDEHPFWRLEK